MKTVQKRLVAGIASATLIVGGVSAGTAYATSDSESHKTQQSAARSYDAKTVFRGVFFGHGPVAELIPQYFEGGTAETAKTRGTENQIMSQVEQLYPGTIQGFSEAVASGSHVRTKDALLSTSEKVQRVLKDMSSDETQQQVKGQAIVLAIGVVAAVAVTVWKYVKNYSSAAEADSGPLKIDGLVHDLVTRVN